VTDLRVNEEGAKSSDFQPQIEVPEPHFDIDFNHPKVHKPTLNQFGFRSLISLN
jgi:hypothetical protein